MIASVAAGSLRAEAGQAPQPLQSYLRPGVLQLATLPPLSLYVHLPWCLKKCSYCDFNSHQMRSSELPQQRYLEALLADIETALPLVWGRSIQSVFIGGGTPSLFSPDGIDFLLGRLRSLLAVVPDCEVTLEANPGTFERERFRAYRSAGVNRLSIGVQTFNDDLLRSLGRVHDAAQAQAAVEEAAQAFDNFNLDIMYALPGQTLADLRLDLVRALALAAPHISVYQLTVEPNTYFAKFAPVLPDADTAYAMLDLVTELTAAAGLQRYEVSAYARAGRRCRHNLNYWQFGDYLGVGAGAHSKISFAHRVVRQVRLREPTQYMHHALAGHCLTQETELSRADLPFEFMLNALRLKDGFLLQQFSDRTGLPLSAIDSVLFEAQHQGLLECDSTRVKPTARGFDFLNDLQSLFLPT